MNLEKAALLIRVAKQLSDGEDKRALLTWAEELLSGNSAIPIDTKTGINLPLPIFARLKGKRYDGLLLAGYRVQTNGETYRSTSAAAMSIAGYPANGWTFWRYVNDQGTEKAIDELRKRH